MNTCTFILLRVWNQNFTYIVAFSFQNKDTDLFCIPSATFRKLDVCWDSDAKQLTYIQHKTNAIDGTSEESANTSSENTLSKTTLAEEEDKKKRIFSLARILNRHWPIIMHRIAAENSDEKPDVRIISIKKKPFDPISHTGSFGGIQKRKFDSIAYLSSFGRLRKRIFDSIAHMGSFGDFQKRRFDSISHYGHFGGMKKRPFDSIAFSSGFGRLQKRPFDSINYASSFGGFGWINENINYMRIDMYNKLKFLLSFDDFS